MIAGVKIPLPFSRVLWVNWWDLIKKKTPFSSSLSYFSPLWYHCMDIVDITFLFSMPTSHGHMLLLYLQVIIVGPPDIELLCCVKDINLRIHWSLITMRKKSTSEMMKLSLNFKTVGTGLPSDWVVNFDSYWSHSKCRIILPDVVAKFFWEIIISSQVVIKNSSEWLKGR